MEFVPAPNVIEMEMRHLLDGQRVENTLYFRNLNGPWASQEAATFAQTVGSWYTTGPLAQLSDALSWREVYITDLSSVNGFTVTVPLVPPTQGAIGGECEPNSVSACVSFRTEFRGRSFRGRNYLAGIPASAITFNTFNPSFVNHMNDAYSDLIAVAAGVNVEWVVVSRISEGLPRATAFIAPITAAFMVDTTVDSQRRRLPGRGR